jgi:hypothetical protein
MNSPFHLNYLVCVMFSLNNSCIGKFVICMFFYLYNDVITPQLLYSFEVNFLKMEGL